MSIVSVLFSDSWCCSDMGMGFLRGDLATREYVLPDLSAGVPCVNRHVSHLSLFFWRTSCDNTAVSLFKPAGGIGELRTAAKAWLRPWWRTMWKAPARGQREQYKAAILLGVDELRLRGESEHVLPHSPSAAVCMMAL